MAHNSETFFQSQDQGGKLRDGFQGAKAAQQPPKRYKANFGQLLESRTRILEAI